MFILYMFSNVEFFLSWVVIVMFSVCLHELFHALAAYWQGDDTARRAGYWTLNPMVHMGPASLLVLLLFGLCWGACPVNPARFRHRYSEALVSFAGPLANLLLVLACGLLTLLIVNVAGIPSQTTSPLAYSLLQVVQLANMLNAALFLLNMIPVPPLDGYGVVQSLIPRTRPLYARLGNAGFLILIAAMWLPLGFQRLFWDCAHLFAESVSLLPLSVIGLFRA